MAFLTVIPPFSSIYFSYYVRHDLYILIISCGVLPGAEPDLLDHEIA